MNYIDKRKYKYILMTAATASVLISSPVEPADRLSASLPFAQMNINRPWENTEKSLYALNTAQIPEEVGIVCNFIHDLYSNSVDIDPAIRKIIDKDFWELI